MQTAVTSILAFAATNIDDIFILTLFFSLRRFKFSTIVIGQSFGIGALVIISLAGAYAGNFIDQRYVGILGLFPIYLAIKHILETVRKKDDEPGQEMVGSSAGVFAIAGITIANGGDNIGVYVPLMTTMSSMDKIQLVVIFAFMTYLWCLIGKYLASHPLIAKQLDRFGHIIMPLVLLLLGIFILIESKTLSLLG